MKIAEDFQDADRLRDLMPKSSDDRSLWLGKALAPFPPCGIELGV
jgi:hypothetical protein